MRIVSLVLLVSLLATLGLLACLAPVATTPAPAATATPEFTPAWTPIPTPPPPTPRPGQTLLSTETVKYGYGQAAASLSKTLALKKGDVVVFTYILTGPNAWLSVDDPTRAWALQRTSFVQPHTTGTRSFQATMDGDYVCTGGEGAAGGASVALTIEIYR